MASVRKNNRPSLPGRGRQPQDPNLVVVWPFRIGKNRAAAGSIVASTINANLRRALIDDRTYGLQRVSRGARCLNDLRLDSFEVIDLNLRRRSNSGDETANHVRPAVRV